jgi:phospholipase A1/A2
MAPLVFAFLFWCPDAFAQVPPALFDDTKQIYRKVLETKYVLLPHKGTYLLPLTYTTNPDEDIYAPIKNATSAGKGDLYRNEEAEFQVSFMLPVVRELFDTTLDLHFAYTHRAWWQVYNASWSRPFRETNYSPELFVRQIDPKKNKILGFDLLGFDLGYTHNSNGQVEALSRSWERIFGRAFLRRSAFMIFVGGWYRIPYRSERDDNPDIKKYLGHGELELHRSLGSHSLSLKVPLAAKYFGANLGYSYPLK